METIQIGGHRAVGFGVGSGSVVVPLSKTEGFILGAAITALGGTIGASFFGEGASADDRILNESLVLIFAGLGGGVAGAILAPGRP